MNLRGHHKINSYKKNRPRIQLNDVVIIGNASRPCLSWRLAKVEKLVESNDKQIRGAIVRVSKTNKLAAKPVNKLNDLAERFSCEDIDVNTNKPPREAAVIGELKGNTVHIRRILLRYVSFFWECLISLLLYSGFLVYTFLKFIELVS